MMIVVVTIVAIFYGSIHSRNMEDQRLATEVSEAKVVAANMIAYRNHVAEYVKLVSSDDKAVNFHRYLSFTGSAKQFMMDTPEDRKPKDFEWFETFPGVDGYIRQGEMYVYYKKIPSGVGPSEAGVQKELLALSHRSNRVGIIVPTP